jgi:uncharacterized protein YegP (UPF0339 family)
VCNIQLARPDGENEGDGEPREHLGSPFLFHEQARRLVEVAHEAADDDPASAPDASRVISGPEGRKSRMLTFQIYIDQSNQYRWRLYAANNRIIGDSGEGYVNLRDCEAMVELIKKNAPTAQVQVKTPR